MKRQVLHASALTVLMLVSCRGGVADRRQLPAAQASVPGCQAQGAEVERPGAPLRPAPAVSFEPGDLTTAVDGAQLRIAVDNLGAKVGGKALNELAKRVRVVTYPEMEEVPSSVAVSDVGGPAYGESGFGRNERAYVYVTPASPLLGRWYAVGVTGLPVGMRWKAFGTQHDVGGGIVGSRFSTVSSLTVSRVRLCQKDEGKKVVIVELSEDVALSNATDAALKVGGPGGECRLEKPNANAGKGAALRFDCSSVDLSSGEVQANLRGLKGLGGTVGRPNDRAEQIRVGLGPKSMEHDGEGCLAVKP